MLRTKLFKAFAVLVIVFSVLAGFVGISMIHGRLMEEAQARVLDALSSAKAVYDARLREVKTVAQLAASQKDVVDAGLSRSWQNQTLQNRLEMIRLNFGLDFLTLVSPDGEVVLRAAAPYNTGDLRLSDPLVAKALQGESVSGMSLVSQAELRREADNLAERAFIALEDTPHARPGSKTAETRGLIMVSAVPVKYGANVLGALYGGILLNRNAALVDEVADTVFKREVYQGAPLGNATIFLDDSRVATTVRARSGNRAIGTRVSKEVADKVLDNGVPWIGKAFVVDDWYLSAYDPITDARGSVIGMRYVGILAKPFEDLSRTVIYRFAGVVIVCLVLALLLAFVLAGKIAQPIHRLVMAAKRVRRGENPGSVPVCDACKETQDLIVAFNQMVDTLFEREARLKEANDKLETANDSLTALNASYMETLGFVSHELKSPIASIMNYVYLVRSGKLGPLTERQEKALRSIDDSVKRIVEMARHYLNLSRIESGELHPVLGRVNVAEEVIRPLLESFDADVQAHRLQIVNRVEPQPLVHADLNMLREVFENLVSNAVKYGRDGGTITLASRRLDDAVEFSVRNEGEGIPADKRPAIFQKFSRLENTPAARRQKGTGLGLFITRHIVEAHGGRIDVESRPQEWTEFRFTMPIFKEEKSQ